MVRLVAGDSDSSPPSRNRPRSCAAPRRHGQWPGLAPRPVTPTVPDAPTPPAPRSVSRPEPPVPEPESPAPRLATAAPDPVAGPPIARCRPRKPPWSRRSCGERVGRGPGRGLEAGRRRARVRLRRPFPSGSRRLQEITSEDHGRRARRRSVGSTAASVVGSAAIGGPATGSGAAVASRGAGDSGSGTGGSGVTRSSGAEASARRDRRRDGREARGLATVRGVVARRTTGTISARWASVAVSRDQPHHPRAGLRSLVAGRHAHDDPHTDREEGVQAQGADGAHPGSSPQPMDHDPAIIGGISRWRRPARRALRLQQDDVAGRVVRPEDEDLREEEPICLGGKFHDAITWRPTSSSVGNTP